jgi:hypothetical protein
MIVHAAIPVNETDDRISPLLFWLFCFYGILYFILVLYYYYYYY